jgi:hypothetical protein
VIATFPPVPIPYFPSRKVWLPVTIAFFVALFDAEIFMKKGIGTVWLLSLAIAGLSVFATSQGKASITEVDWTSSGFSTSHITIHAGDEVDTVNFDDTFDLQMTGAPPGAAWSAVSPPGLLGDQCGDQFHFRREGFLSIERPLGGLRLECLSTSRSDSSASQKTVSGARIHAFHGPV